MSHVLDTPIAYAYRGSSMVIKFEWARPNDAVPVLARVIQPSEIEGLGDVAAELSGPWDDYRSALDDAKIAAERWVDSQRPYQQSGSGASISRKRQGA